MENTANTLNEINIKVLIEKKGSSLKWAKKIDYRSLELSVVEDHVFKKGLPCVISNTTRAWQRDREMFSWDWLKKNFGKTQISPRDNETFSDLQGWTVSQYIEYIQKPAIQRDRKLYGKDIPCPTQWKEFISSKIPEFWCKGPNDLMRDLLPELQAETLMIYVGYEENSTPGHVDIIGSLGHNLMVYADEGAYSLWFLISTEDRDKAIEFWKKKSCGSLFDDNQWISPEELAKAPFTVYVIEQREGDFILIPSESAHQVINKGGKSVKIAWNTIRSQSIENSYHSALPMYRSLGKPEIYRIKATAYYSLINRVQAVEEGNSKANNETLIEDFPPLLSVVEDIIASEWIELDEGEELDIDIERFIDDDFPHQRTCDFCSCDIWNRCYHCKDCGTEKGGYDICLACVAEGRGCIHKEKLILMEYLSVGHIKKYFERGVEAYEKLLKSFKRKKNKKRKHVEWSPTEDREEVSVATIAYKLVKMYGKENNTEMCHQCEKIQPYSQAILVHCTNIPNRTKCDKKYCSKCLWNRYGQKVIDCLSISDWICPFCEGRCNCNPCLEKKGINPMDFCLEDVLKNVLDAQYPFQSFTQPNVPCVSDSKPYLHIHALKKRKMYGISSPSGSLSPASTPVTPKDLSKMTARQQIRFLTSGETPKIIPSVDSPISPKSVPAPRKRGRPRKEKSEDKKEEQRNLSSSSNSESSDSDSDRSPPSKKIEIKEFNSQKIEKREFKEKQKQEGREEFKQAKIEFKETKPELLKQEFQNHSFSYSSQNDGIGYSLSHNEIKQQETALSYSINGSGLGDKWEDKRSSFFSIHDPSDKRPMDYINIDSQRAVAWDSTTRQDTNLLNVNGTNLSSPILNGLIPNGPTPTSYDVDHYSTVLVRNLNYSCTTDDLGDLFKQCGPIDQITIPVDKITGKLRGYGFVKYRNRTDAEQAMQKLNLRVLKDRVIELEWSMDKAQQRKDGKLVCYKCGGDGHFARDCTAFQATRRDYDRDGIEKDIWERPLRGENINAPSDISQRIHRGYICFKCGKEGHVANDCKEKQEVGPGFRGVVCFKCGQGGHLANKCDKKMRGCFICGHDGHIAVECDQRYSSGLMPLPEGYQKPVDGTSSWPTEPSKYRKLDTSPASREPITKDNVWNDQERDGDRERMRERKVTGWDDKEPRQEIRYTDPRDPRFANVDPRYTDTRYQNTYGAANYAPYSNTSSNYYTNAGYTERKTGWDDRDSRYPDRYSSRDDPRYPRDPRDSRDPRDTRYSRPIDESRYPNNADPYGSRSYSTQDPKISAGDPYRQDPNLPQTPMQTGYFGVQPNIPSSYTQPQDPTYPLMGGQIAVPAGVPQTVPQLTPTQPSPSMQSPGAPSSNSKEDPKKRNFKHHCSKIVVNRLSTFFNNGQISSKEDFKQLSRKIVVALLEKEQSRGFIIDRDTDNKIKKFVDNYYAQYQQLVTTHKENNRYKVEDWLNRMEMYSPSSATTY